MGKIQAMKSRLSFYATKRRINLIFAQFGISLGICLLLLQIQTTALETASNQSTSWLNSASSAIEPFTNIILNVLINLFTLGGL